MHKASYPKMHLKLPKQQNDWPEMSSPSHSIFQNMGNPLSLLRPKLQTYLPLRIFRQQYEGLPVIFPLFPSLYYELTYSSHVGRPLNNLPKYLST